MVFNCKFILYLLWKEILNKAGQQFHQYQQCEQLPFASISLNTKNILTYANGNPDLGLGQIQ